MIVLLHVATGAVAGALAGTRARALALGPLLHIAGDLMPHGEIRSRRFEIASGAVGVLALAARRGLFDPTVVGALAACAPDVEHLSPRLQPGGRRHFPSHRFRGWHRSGRVPAWAQLLAAGIFLGVLVNAGGEGRNSTSPSPPAGR